MLILESVYQLQVGIVVDTHLHAVFPALGWAKKGQSAEDVAREVEAWTMNTPLQKHWQNMNTYMCGLRQMGETNEVREDLLKRAEDMGEEYLEIVKLVLEAKK